MNRLALSRPARAVVIEGRQPLDDAIEAERTRRAALKNRRRPYRYWRERGDEQAPREEFWCDRCVGYYGVPHDTFTHRKGELCRNLGKYRGCRQCACLECVVFEAWAASRSS